MDKLLDVTMNFLYRNEEGMNAEQAEIVRYGLELLFLKASFFAATMIIGILMRSFWECLVFTLLLSGIRTTAGGFHASTRMKCFIMSMLTFTIVLIILKMVDIYNIILLPLTILALLSAMIIWKFSPIDTENKPLEEGEYAIFRKKARTMLFFEIGVAITAYLLGLLGVACSVLLALIITGLLMTAELFKKIRK